MQRAGLIETLADSAAYPWRHDVCSLLFRRQTGALKSMRRRLTVNANEPVEVYASKTLADAEIVKNYLESEGIKCVLEGENQASLSGLLTVRILVRAWDEEKAQRILALHMHLPAVGLGEHARH